MAYEKTIWSAGTRIKPAHVTIGGEEYEVIPETREGGTPFSVSNMQKLEDGVVAANEVAISPTEPTTGEEVWIKKGKNLLKLEPKTITQNGVTLIVNSDGSITLNGTATANTSIVFSSQVFYGVGDYAFGVTTDITEYKPYSLEIAGYVYDANGSYKYNLSSAHPTRTLLEGDRVKNFNVFFLSGASFNNLTLYPQLEQGTTPTSFEPHVDKEIYVKNDNGVYELFSKNENTSIVTNQLMPTNEYIDGKRVYVKRVDFGALPNASTKTLSTGISKSLYNFEYFRGKAISGTYTISLPNISLHGLNYCTTCGIDGSATTYQVEITTGTDRSAWTGIIDIYVTKK